MNIFLCPYLHIPLRNKLFLCMNEADLDAKNSAILAKKQPKVAKY